MDIPTFSARNLPFVIDAIVDFPDESRTGLSQLLGITAAEADALVAAAEMLGVIDATGQPAEVASLIRSASLVGRREILRFYLEKFPPYESWKRRLVQGFDELEAARQVRAVHGIVQPPAQIRDRFIDLGTYSGSIAQTDSGFDVTKGPKPELGSLISGLLNDDQAAKDVLADYLGPGATWEKLPETVRDHLTTALLKLSANGSPDEAVREAGLAMDRYMADLGTALRGAGYVGLTMGQAASKLLDDGCLRDKHKGYTLYGVSIRNAAEHPDTDPQLGGDSWSINARSAITYLRAVLDFIRSASALVDGRHEL